MNRIIVCLGVLLALQACTKTEYTDYEERDMNRVLKYSVTNVQQELSGAIDNDQNTITVYIPYYISVDYLEGEFTLDEGAKLLDSLGNEINLDGGLELIPLGNPVKYIVESSKGVRRNYTLVQKILPHGDPLVAAYSDLAEGATELYKPINTSLKIVGNFESTSLNAKFYLTNKATGQVYDDFIIPTALVPGAQYTMTTYISPEALAGEYDVRLEHVGRVTQLPSLNLRYQKPMATYFFSSASFAAGDTITFSITPIPAFYDNTATTFVGVEKIYIKITKGLITVPAGFPEDLYGTAIPLEIVSKNRTEMKAIFPSLPAGQYTGNISTTQTIDGASIYATAGFGFYCDFEDSMGWADGHIFTTVSGIRFTVNPTE